MSISESAIPNSAGSRPRPRYSVLDALRRFKQTQTAVVIGWAMLAGGFLAIWELLARMGQINILFFSYPSMICKALLEGIKGDMITNDVRYTVIAAFVGFLFATIAGVIVAFALSQLPYCARLLRPFFTGLNSLPRVALAPLFILWFGIGLTSHIVMAASLTFFVVFANTTAGIESIDQDHLLLSRLQGATRWQTFWLFVVPSALPSLFVGLELGFIFAMLGTVSGEMIAGEHGLGVRLQRDAGIFNTAGYFATLFVLIVISSILIMMFHFLKSYFLRWQTLHVTARKS